MESNNSNDTNKNYILFLHGFTQNSEVLKKRTKVLVQKLEKEYSKNNIDFIFPNAPHNLPEEGQKAWFYFNEEDKMDSKLLEKENATYIGFQKSYECILEAIKGKKIFCIFGFSQGALLNLFMTFLISQKILEEESFKYLKGVVFVSCFLKPFPLNTDYDLSKKLREFVELDKKIEIPSLHIFGENDLYIKPELSKKVLEIFDNPDVYQHKGKHYIPTNKEDIEVYIKFFNKIMNI